MREIDVRGLSCPEPVLMLKNALEADKNETYKIFANEAHTVKNLKNFAETHGKKADIKEVGAEYEVTVS
ncbi:MAG: sulfurtransferase TusA family protein [Catonella sp.]|uniref:sulfurtransferase TusA family protein n=1 Tax=Catonella sp. TaxID=2382125 RepID=UPI003FA14759